MNRKQYLIQNIRSKKAFGSFEKNITDLERSDYLSKKMFLEEFWNPGIQEKAA